MTATRRKDPTGPRYYRRRQPGPQHAGPPAPAYTGLGRPWSHRLRRTLDPPSAAVARMLGISRDELTALVHARALQQTGGNGKRRITLASLAAYLGHPWAGEQLLHRLGGL